MTEKITRAQADAAVDRMSYWLPRQMTSDGDWESATLEGLDSLNTLRSYLAQQPTEDVVRKAHEALDYIEQADFVPDNGSWEENVAEVRAALPPLPEEK